MKDEKGILVFNFWTEFDSSRSAESVWPPHLPPSSLLGRGVRPTRLFGIIESVLATIVGVALFAYLGPHSLIRLKRRLSSRLYVLMGRPLASVEGHPTLEPSSESGYSGIQVGAFISISMFAGWVWKTEH
ncbi:MAG TPA: hypothetical protein VJ124_13430 [Pyrinomonadaceae bacterium]|nr:hypothetical protein [Pyrinomonadaceae bacterium]